MTDMLERVAKALYEDNYQMLGDFSPSNWSAMGADVQKEYKDMAKAAIQALMEPDEGMVDLGYDLIDAGAEIPEIYQAMLRHVLEEG